MGNPDIVSLNEYKKFIDLLQSSFLLQKTKNIKPQKNKMSNGNK